MTGCARIIRGNALALPLADASVDLICTSPPYFGLRSYSDNGVHYPGQLGSEATPAEFVDALIAATREMVRVLKPSGSIFVNLGDKYCHAGRTRPKGNAEIVAYLTAAGEDLGLFGDEGEAPSQPQGRWPANVVLDRSQAAALDQMSGERASSIWPEGGKSSGGLLNGTEEKRTEPTGYADTGGASRFFKVVDDDLGDGAA